MSSKAERLRAERRATVFGLAKKGVSLRDIGEQLGISHTQARRDLDAVLEGLRPDAGDTERERQLVLAGLKALKVEGWAKIKTDFAVAAGIILRASWQEMRAWHMDKSAPTEEMMAEFEALAAERGVPVEDVLESADAVARAAFEKRR